MGKVTESGIGQRLISIVAALFLFMYVMYNEHPQVVYWIRGIPVEFSKYDHFKENELALISQKESFTTDIKVRTYKTLLNQVVAKYTKATVDLSGVTSADVYNLPITYAFQSEGVEILEKRPGTVDVEVDKLVKVNLPIEVDITGTTEQGYTLNTSFASPAEAIIVAPLQDTKQPIKAVVEVDITGANDDFMVKRPIKLYDRQGQLILNSLLQLETSYTEVSCFINQQKEFIVLPSLSSVPPGFSVASLHFTPRTITVTGSGDTIAAIQGVKTTPAVVLPAQEGKIEREVSVVLPDGATSDVDKVTVFVELKRNEE